MWHAGENKRVLTDKKRYFSLINKAAGMFPTKKKKMLVNLQEISEQTVLLQLLSPELTSTSEDDRGKHTEIKGNSSRRCAVSPHDT